MLMLKLKTWRSNRFSLISVNHQYKLCAFSLDAAYQLKAEARVTGDLL
jgi:hypothetical protein